MKEDLLGRIKVTRGGRTADNSPLSLPKMKMKTDCSPNKQRKYHDRLDTHRTSRSLVMTPDWSMDLKRMVRGNGSLTVTAGQHLFAY